ncbi:MAG TPA: hypothetical protein VLY23_12100 [Candidatus Acidoferrum sp.]|nr:hypothetical protein [Candidatus Acidoferrum sp.]
MATMANGNWNPDAAAVAKGMAIESAGASERVHEAVRAVRDIAIVLMIQIAFRTMLVLRRWNY